MQVERSYIELKKGRIHLRKVGRGSALMLAIHGFGQSGIAFKKLTADLGHMYTFYLIDLPWHGQTEWATSDFKRKDLRTVIQHILDLEAKTSYTALGFSLGARLWLGLLPKEKWRIDKLFLLAPDGIRTYRSGLANSIPKPLRRILAKAIDILPYPILRIMDLAHRLGILDILGYRYIYHHLDDAARRKRLLSIWLMTPNFPIRKRIRRIDIPLIFILAEEDEMVDTEAIAAFAENLSSAEVHHVPTDHRVLQEPKVGEIITGA